MMNATKGGTRSLRERRQVNYNLDAIELGLYSDDEAKPRKIKAKTR